MYLVKSIAEPVPHQTLASRFSRSKGGVRRLDDAEEAVT